MCRTAQFAAVPKAAVTVTGAVAAASSAAGDASVASAEPPVSSRASPRVCAEEGREQANTVGHGGAVDVALRVLLTDVRHVGHESVELLDHVARQAAHGPRTVDQERGASVRLLGRRASSAARAHRRDPWNDRTSIYGEFIPVPENPRKQSE